MNCGKRAFVRFEDELSAGFPALVNDPFPDWNQFFEMPRNISDVNRTFDLYRRWRRNGSLKRIREDRRYGWSRWNRISLFDYHKEKNIVHTDLSPPTNESHIESTIGPGTRFRLFASINYKLLQGASSSEQISLRSTFLRSGKRREKMYLIQIQWVQAGLG